MAANDARLTWADAVHANAALSMKEVLDGVRAASGVAGAGVFIEGTLAGAADWLHREFGPAVAYEALQRTCDAIARRLVDEHSAQQRTP